MWILQNGIWEDIRIWDDSDVWRDAPSAGVSGSLATVEASDTATFSGSVVSVIFGALTAIENADTASFSDAPLQIFGFLSAAERTDVAKITIDVSTPHEFDQPGELNLGIQPVFHAKSYW